MARKGAAVYICGGDTRPGPRGTDCPNALHDHPLPNGYVDASEEASHRLYKRWINRKCPDCGLYGWVPPMGGADG
jgi:hypothetical protein